MKIAILSLITNLRDTKGNLHSATSFPSRRIDSSLVDHYAAQLHGPALKGRSSLFFSRFNCLLKRLNLALENSYFNRLDKGCELLDSIVCAL